MKYSPNFAEEKTPFESQHPPRKRDFLTFKGDFDKIIDTNRSELCLLSV
jgi:hypothetical protein